MPLSCVLVFIPPACDPPGLVFASQTSYSKPQRFQNKPQKEGVNLPFGFWLSQNRSALLLVRTSTTTHFQVSPHISRFLSSLHPLSPLWVTCTLYNGRMVAPPSRSSLQHHYGPTSASPFPHFPLNNFIQFSGDWDEGAHCKQREGKKTTSTDLLTLLSHGTTK